MTGTCPKCKGDKKCVVCSGTGRVKVNIYTKPCETCGGLGLCDWCRGRGVLEEVEPLITKKKETVAVQTQTTLDEPYEIR